MATRTYYIDYNTGNDSTGTGATGSPWATVAHALSAGTYSSGDTVNIRIRQTSGTKEDVIGTLSSTHNGNTINIFPDVAGTQIKMQMTTGGFSWVLVNTGTTSAINLNIKNITLTGGNVAHGVFCNGDLAAINVTLEDCNLTSAFASGNEVFTTGNAVSPTTNFPSFTCRRCTFTGFTYLVFSTWMGTLDIDDYTSFVPGIVTGQSAQTINVGRFTSLKIRGGSKIVRTDAQNFGILATTPRDCTQILIQDAILDMSGATGSFPAVVQIEQFDAATPVNTTCTITIDKSLIQCNGSGVECLRLGQDDSLSLPRTQQRAAQVNRFGQVTVTSNKFYNAATHGGGGIMIGLGTDGQSQNAGAIVTGNFIRNADPTDASASGHGTVLAGDNITFTKNVCVGYLGIVNFGDYNTATNNTVEVQSSGFLEGLTGGGSWSESTGSVVEDNIFVALSSVVAQDVFVVSDYAYNTRYVTHTFTGRWNRNLIYAPNGSTWRISTAPNARALPKCRRSGRRVGARIRTTICSR